MNLRHTTPIEGGRPPQNFTPTFTMAVFMAGMLFVSQHRAVAGARLRPFQQVEAVLPDEGRGRLPGVEEVGDGGALELAPTGLGLISPIAGVRMPLMRQTVTLPVVVFVLAVCLVCPVMEMFDQWDHTPQTGNDTESALVVVALCLGATFLLSCVILEILRSSARGGIGCPSCFLRASALLPVAPDSVFPISISPPLTNLRI